MSYRVLRQLSGGGFSDVFEVEDPASALPEQLILKRLNAEMSARPEVGAAFSDEAKILRELKHPNIVTFRRCYFDEARRVCLLMEKVAGEPLDAWARQHGSRPDKVLDLFEQVLQAVDYLHRRASPYLHLDLKPDNILVSSSPQGIHPVLIDFGIARRSGGKGLKAYTPPYGAPEQEAGGTLDCATDVHALGQILTEILKSLNLPEGPAREALAAVAAKARNPSRRQRFADAGEMGLAFRRARRSTPLPASKPWSIQTLPQLPRWVYLAGTVGVLGIALLAGILWMRGDSASVPEPLTEATAASEGEGGRERFDGLLAQARQAAREGRFDNADRQFMEARRLWEATPSTGELSRAMERDLMSLRSQIDLVRQGGLAGERVRMEMK
jgi:serine/threonine-protein kinase